MSQFKIPNLEKLTREERETLAAGFLEQATIAEMQADIARAEAETHLAVHRDQLKAAYALRQLARAARSLDSETA